jgi:pyruvate kinase
MDTQRLQTKIVWSLDKSTIEKMNEKSLTEAKYDVLRFVYRPGSVESVAGFIKEYQQTARGKRSALMVDVSHYLHSTVSQVNLAPDLQYEQILTLSPEPGVGDLTVECPHWKTTFVEGSLVYIGFGVVVLKTLNVSDTQVKAQVVQSGTLRVGMNVFDAQTYKQPSVFDLTGVDISPFKNIDVDYVVIPGIASAREVSVIRKKLSLDLKSTPWIVMRIDNKKAYENLTELLPQIDGVMLPRRELALSLDPAYVPIVCKEIIQTCHEKAKVVIMESDLLASLRFNPTPTRAEVSDIANAVIDGTDAVVLSEDLILGPYVDRALNVCRNIIGDIESQGSVLVNWMSRDFVSSTEFEAVAYQAYKTAERVKAKAIVCITRNGNTALRLSSFRSTFPIIAVTFSSQTQRKLALVRGVTSLLLEIDPDIDEVLPLVKKRLSAYPWMKEGDLIVFITVTLSPVGLEASNLLTVQQLGPREEMGLESVSV